MQHTRYKIQARSIHWATVSDPEYFQIGQRGKIVSIQEDIHSPDGYAYYIEFVDGEVYWYLDCDEFVWNSNRRIENG